MKERPILFSAPMVRAILNGTKTQTRRAVKGIDGVFTLCPGEVVDQCIVAVGEKAHRPWPMGEHPDRPHDFHPLRCPYGQAGDRLWVRETWTVPYLWRGGDKIALEDLRYRADNNLRLPWHPAIHMPRLASRITLEITGVRVERLNEISELDAISEGIEKHPNEKLWRIVPNPRGPMGGYTPIPIHAYRMLWESINGSGSWDANQWVWVVDFKRVDGGSK